MVTGMVWLISVYTMVQAIDKLSCKLSTIIMVSGYRCAKESWTCTQYNSATRVTVTFDCRGC